MCLWDGAALRRGEGSRGDGLTSQVKEEGGKVSHLVPQRGLAVPRPCQQSKLKGVLLIFFSVHKANPSFVCDCKHGPCKGWSRSAEAWVGVCSCEGPAQGASGFLLHAGGGQARAAGVQQLRQLC